MNPVLLEESVNNYFSDIKAEVFDYEYVKYTDNERFKREEEYYNHFPHERQPDYGKVLTVIYINNKIEWFFHVNTLAKDNKIEFLLRLETKILDWIDSFKEEEARLKKSDTSDDFGLYLDIGETILRYNKCKDYITYELIVLDDPLNNPESKPVQETNAVEETNLVAKEKNTLHWENKTELVELIHALFLSKSIKVNGRDIQRNELIKAFETFFNTDLKTYDSLLKQGINAKTKTSFTSTLQNLIKENKEGKDKIK